MKADIAEAKSVHFIGIGGIGVSAVARMMLLEGKTVSGSDRSASKVTEELARAGAQIFIGQEAQNVPDKCDLVVYTVAIPQDNPEMERARERSIPMLSYPETLEQISKEKFTIAVSGTHGKTTTTAMIARVLIDAGLDPTVIVGSFMKLPDGGQSNYIAGKSKYLVVEADEYKKSFHNLYPSVLVINNLDLDHLDFYKDLADIQDSFREVAKRVPADGFIVTDLSNANAAPVVQGLTSKLIDYKKYIQDDLKLRVPGQHNLSNAAAALGVAEALGLDLEKARQSLESFEGVWRRFEFKGNTSRGALVYDDYAHNPQKVSAALQGAREAFPGKKVIAIFQPHLFSRTKTLFKEFISAFDDADAILLTPIYPAREVFDPSISSEMLASALRDHGKSAEAFTDFQSIEARVRENYNSKDHLILVMGAGDINETAEALVRAQE